MPTEPISGISIPVELPSACSGHHEQDQMAMNSYKEILVDTPPQREIYPADQPLTEAMKLQMHYDLRMSHMLSVDSIKTKDFEVECSSEFQKQDQVEDVAVQIQDGECSNDTETLQAAYQTDVYQTDQLSRVEECLDISTNSQSEQMMIYQQECDSTASGHLDEIAVVESSLRVVNLNDECSIEYRESSVFLQSANCDQPGGNAERLAQEIEAVGKKSGFGAMSLFEKYKEAIDMENDEEDCDFEDSVVYDEENDIITGVNENGDDICNWQQNDVQIQEDASIETLSKEDLDQLQDPQASRSRLHQGPSIVHFTPSSPTETTEEDCGENDSKLFSSSNSEANECNLGEIENQKDLAPYLIDSGSLTSMHDLSEEDIQDEGLFESHLPVSSDSYENGFLTKSVPQSSIDHRTNFTSESGSEKDVVHVLQKMNSPWQQQRLEPSEGECFV